MNMNINHKHLIMHQIENYNKVYSKIKYKIFINKYH